MKKKWSELSPRTRRLIVAESAVEGALKAAALVDLARRPAGEVRGPKIAWSIALTLVNSLGLLPIVYFRYGRRTS